MSADSLTFKDLNACVLYMLCFLRGPLKNSIKSFPLIWDIPILRKLPGRLAQPGVYG